MKIHFIIFYKNNECIQKCLSCIESLEIPNGVEIDVLGVNEGNSICEAYNCAMHESDADVKVYLRENFYIVNPHFLDNLIEFFEDNTDIEVAGIVGGRRVCEFVEWETGCIDIYNKHRRTRYISNERKDVICDYLLGGLIATKRDYSWGNDDTFFDICFCDNVREAGANIGVFNQSEAWCIWEYGKALNERLDVITENNKGWCFLGEKPLVSVMMVSYNAKEFIADGIDSILAQTYENMEIILADSGSTDGTREIILDYAKKDHRIVPLLLEVNNHACYTSNIGRKKAKGKYLAILGHDDWWQAGKIEEQVTFLEHENSVDVCFTTTHILGDYNIVKDNDNPYYRLFKTENRGKDEWLKDLYLEGNQLCAASAMLRLAKTPENLYKLDNIQLQDYELWMHMLFDGDIYIIQEDLTYYRNFENQHDNLSTIRNDDTPKNIRLVNEMGNARYRILRDMPDDLFKRCFKNVFTKQDACTHEELMCERAFLLYNKHSRNFMNIFWEMLEDDNYVEILNKEYNFTLIDYYEMETKLML